MQTQSSLASRGGRKHLPWLFNHAVFLLASFLAFLSVQFQPVLAQQIIRHPDGTVEVSDDDSSGASAPVYPVAATAAHHAGQKQVHHSQARAGSKAAGRRQAAQASQASGRIPAYTRHEGGVTIRRHADGTVDIVDDMTTYSPAVHSSKRRASTRRRIASH